MMVKMNEKTRRMIGDIIISASEKHPQRIANI
jgi:hypothetical protein